MNQTKMLEEIVKVLEKNGYVNSFERKGRGVKRVLEIKLGYESGKGIINGVRFMSKPSRKVYLGYRDIRPVKQGHGLMVLSTPAGIVTGQEARKAKVGGEALFQIW